MLIVMALACGLVGFLVADSRAQKAADEMGGANSKCYVCHAGMKTEELTTNHLAVEVTCDKCHGPSIEHMHDEMLMTEPDLLFGRSQVEGLCAKCHNGHKNPDAVSAFRKEWAGRIRSNGRNIADDAVCTDCHGTHNIANQAGAEIERQRQEQWLSAFNGSDLTGWESSDGSSWKVKSGRICGIPPAGAKGGTLWTEAQYEDFLLAVTFRVERPINAGICIRGDGSRPGPRVEIIQSDNPQAYSGSVFVPGKGLALVNLRGGLLDDAGWNTISIKAQADRLQVWLNAEEIGAVRTAGPTKGRIGLYVSGNAGELCVREVQIQKLQESGKSEN
jgi:hypothetical protein